MRYRITKPDQLDALPDGSVYVCDLYPDVPETKARGIWWTAGHDPFEPQLPGLCVYRPDEEGIIGIIDSMSRP